jgi:hypothetical protein
MPNPNPVVTSWKPGQSGNPKGAPKKDESLTGLLRTFLNGVDPGTGAPRKQLFIEQAIVNAMKGDSTITKYLWDRLDGQMIASILLQTMTISILPPKEPGETLADTSEGEIEDDESD